MNKNTQSTQKQLSLFSLKG